MKTTLLTLIAFMLAFCSFGQSPEAFKYQAVVRNSGGVILTNQAVGFQIRILHGTHQALMFMLKHFRQVQMVMD